MEYQVRFEEAGKVFGPRVTLYGIVEAEGVEAAVAAATKQLVSKLQRLPQLMGFEPKSVWSERLGVVLL